MKDHELEALRTFFKIRSVRAMYTKVIEAAERVPSPQRRDAFAALAKLNNDQGGREEDAQGRECVAGGESMEAGCRGGRERRPAADGSMNTVKPTEGRSSITFVTSGTGTLGGPRTTTGAWMPTGRSRALEGRSPAGRGWTPQGVIPAGLGRTPQGRII